MYGRAGWHGKAPELAKAFVGDAPFLLTYGDILGETGDYRQMLARWGRGYRG